MQPHAAGTVVADRYEVLSMIGAGANGAVYQARDRQLDRVVALKQMKRATDEPDRERRFEQEAALLKSLRHPCIPQILDYFSIEGELYVAMEFIEGLSLYQVVQQQGPVEVKTALDYMAQVCDVLAYLHGQHIPIVHRDIKPQNLILRQQDSKIAVVDFGLARALSANRNSEAVGTLGYCPLEQLQGRAERRSDIYAVGVTLYYLLAAKAPRALKTPSLEQATAGAVAPQVAFIVNMACQTQPNLRYASSEKMAIALRRARTELEKPPQESSDKSKATELNVSKSGCMGMGLLVIGVGLSVALWLRHPQMVNGDGGRWNSTNPGLSLTGATRF